MNDPIVEEVYEARAQIMKECGGSLKQLIRKIRAKESEHPELMVGPRQVQAGKRRVKDKKPSKSQQVNSKS